MVSMDVRLDEVGVVRERERGLLVWRGEAIVDIVGGFGVKVGIGDILGSLGAGRVVARDLH